MKEVTVSGKSIDEAVSSALDSLNSSKDNVDIQVLEEPRKGFFGLFGAKPARVKVLLKPDPVANAINYLEKVIHLMGITAQVHVTKVNERHYQCELTSEHIAVLIGKRGQTLNALQFLANLTLNKDITKNITMTLDAEGYRERREASLRKLAQRMVLKAKKTSRAVRLEPMPSFERKIIHSAIQGTADIRTASQGEEPHRYVIIYPQKYK
ncbi:RNA-binding cell elongation regulator Jag/EloR [Tuberibacillus sp. Marseille-P3662]|uniref:RNA-binding cell elongation regulator Jag/EloR n=1 Tax=Tuberibacillus sp. Marseille-P3662 TaxID=1965358 RepID=UPI000A1CEB70|nr:RNA-binding cell elongation regulator Jag/EloR [Tuberibacillus sp. Marseille-P3662]